MAGEDTRFKPGQSGNPGGVTKETRAKQTAIKEKALEHCPQAIAELVALMNSSDPKVKLSACNSILDRGLGKPAQALVGDDGDGGPIQVNIVRFGQST